MRRVGHVTCARNIRNTYKVFVGKPERNIQKKKIFVKKIIVALLDAVRSLWDGGGNRKFRY